VSEIKVSCVYRSPIADFHLTMSNDFRYGCWPGTKWRLRSVLLRVRASCRVPSLCMWSNPWPLATTPILNWKHSIGNRTPVSLYPVRHWKCASNFMKRNWWSWPADHLQLFVADVLPPKKLRFVDVVRDDSTTNKDNNYICQIIGALRVWQPNQSNSDSMYFLI